MKKAPKIGDRVCYPGVRNHVGPCTGTIEAIYTNDIWPDDVDWENDDVIPGVTVKPLGIDPDERNWHVRFRCDERPNPWPYGDDLLFAPSVGEIRKLPCLRRS